MLDASVVQRADMSHAWLEIDGIAMRAQVPGDLPAGAALSVRVTRLGARVWLKIVERSADPELVRGAIRGLLPRQRGFAPLLADVSLLAASAGNAPSPWPSALTEAARRLIESLPLAARLGFADALAQALNDSGLFLEARLAAAARTGARAPIEYDFKAALLRFARATRQQGESGAPRGMPGPMTAYPPLREVPLVAQPRVAAPLAALKGSANVVSQMRGEVDGALARLTLLQLGAHPADNPALGWLFELPLRHGDGIDLWQLRVRREPEGDKIAVGGIRWAATLSFSLRDLGPVQARVSVQDGKVSTLFWAEQADTAERYSAALDELAALYEAHGLSVGVLDCHVGEPHAGAPQPSSLLDVKA
jgi:hypothetical protein